MATCPTCGRTLPDDPNELEECTRCRYCDELFCSAPCAEEHEQAEHPGEALPPPDEDERRP